MIIKMIDDHRFTFAHTVHTFPSSFFIHFQIAAQVDAIEDAGAASKMSAAIAVMESLLKGLNPGLQPAENEGLQAQLDCLKSGVKFLEEKKHLEALLAASRAVSQKVERIGSLLASLHQGSQSLGDCPQAKAHGH